MSDKRPVTPSTTAHLSFAVKNGRGCLACDNGYEASKTHHKDSQPGGPYGSTNISKFKVDDNYDDLV